MFSGFSLTKKLFFVKVLLLLLWFTEKITKSATEAWRQKEKMENQLLFARFAFGALILITLFLILWFGREIDRLKKEVREHKADKNEMAHIIAIFYKENRHHSLFHPRFIINAKPTEQISFVVGLEHRPEFEITDLGNVAEVVSDHDKERKLWSGWKPRKCPKKI